MEEKVRERVISERVVGRKIIGSANPIARKFREFKGALGGVCFGPVLIVIALGLLFYSEFFQRSSKIVEALSLENADEVTADSGMHKIKGEPEITSEVEAPQVGEVLYYTYSKQEYKEVEETERESVTKIEDGQEVQEESERTKLVEKWVDVESDSQWAEFKLGDYEIKPSGAKMELKLEKKEYREDRWDEYVEVGSGASSSADIGDFRIIVEYLPEDTEELIVIGEISGSSISGGELFMISNKSDSELTEDIKSAETTKYWITKAGSWLLLTVGLLMMLGPILSLVKIIPIAGSALTCLATVIAAVISLAVVAAGTLVIKFWWLCLGLSVVGVLALVGLVAVLILKKGGGEDKSEGSKNKE